MQDLIQSDSAVVAPSENKGTQDQSQIGAVLAIVIAASAVVMGSMCQVALVAPEVWQASSAYAWFFGALGIFFLAVVAVVAMTASRAREESREFAARRWNADALTRVYHEEVAKFNRGEREM